jgi:hypothetical protein
MPHDATPPERRVPAFRVPSWTVALALIAFFVSAVAAATIATGALLIALPALAVVAGAYCLFYLVTMRRRRSSPWRAGRWSRGTGVVGDSRSLRRRSRLSGSAFP